MAGFQDRFGNIAEYQRQSGKTLKSSASLNQKEMWENVFIDVVVFR